MIAKFLVILNFLMMAPAITAASGSERSSAPSGNALAPGAAGSDRDFKKVKAETGLTPRVPAWLPAGYVFESVDILEYHGRKIAHYRYSDGKNALSLFELPPRTHLDFGMTSRAEFRYGRVKGTLGSSEQGNVLGWSRKGARFVLIGPLNSEVLGRVAESVP